MKMLKFQSTLFAKVGEQKREYKSTPLNIPLVENGQIVEKDVVYVGCQKMIYPDCFDKKNNCKTYCLCNCCKKKNKL